jgi:hypothetical protein
VQEYLKKAARKTATKKSAARNETAKKIQQKKS